MAKIIDRKTGKEGKSAEYYRIHFKQGGLQVCRRCGGYADQYSGDLIDIGGKFLHRKGCRDPED